jgi:uncharacterized protein (DUF952 family)
MAPELYHIIGRDDWAESQRLGRCAPDGYAIEGFIHLSQGDQLLRPANLLYRGRDDLILLRIDPDRLRAELLYELGSHGENEMFPHLYGALNLDAVIGTTPFPPNPDGSFDLPADVR